jgi:hypothetical protein
MMIKKIKLLVILHFLDNQLVFRMDKPKKLAVKYLITVNQKEPLRFSVFKL